MARKIFHEQRQKSSPSSRTPPSAAGTVSYLPIFSTQTSLLKGSRLGSCKARSQAPLTCVVVMQSAPSRLSQKHGAVANEVDCNLSYCCLLSTGSLGPLFIPKAGWETFTRGYIDHIWLILNISCNYCNWGTYYAWCDPKHIFAMTANLRSFTNNKARTSNNGWSMVINHKYTTVSPVNPQQKTMFDRHSPTLPRWWARAVRSSLFFSLIHRDFRCFIPDLIPTF